jgi:hypothetical protein
MELSLQENEELGNFDAIPEFSVSELNQIREKIETMSKFNQIEVLRILHNYNSDVTLNENKYGVHINLSEVKPEIIEKLKKYISYVNTQEITLNQVEKQKENFKNTYFTKDNKETNIKK